MSRTQPTSYSFIVNCFLSVTYIGICFGNNTFLKGSRNNHRFKYGTGLKRIGNVEVTPAFHKIFKLLLVCHCVPACFKLIAYINGCRVWRAVGIKWRRIRHSVYFTRIRIHNQYRGVFRAVLLNRLCYSLFSILLNIIVQSRYNGRSVLCVNCLYNSRRTAVIRFKLSSVYTRKNRIIFVFQSPRAVSSYKTDNVRRYRSQRITSFCIRSEYNAL